MKVKLISQMVNMNKKMISILIGTVLVGTIFSVSISQIVNAQDINIADDSTVNSSFLLESITFKNANGYTDIGDGNVTMYTSNQCTDRSKLTDIYMDTLCEYKNTNLQCTYTITCDGDTNYQQVLQNDNAKYNEYTSDLDRVSWRAWKAGVYNVKLIAKDEFGNIQTKERKINVLKNPDEEQLLLNKSSYLGNPQYIWNTKLDKNTCPVGDTITVRFDYDTADRQGINFKGHTKAFLMLKSIENPFIYHTIDIYSEDLSGHNTAQLSYTFGESCNDYQGGSFKEGHYNISLYIAPEGTSYSFEYPLYDNFTVTPKVDTPADKPSNGVGTDTPADKPNEKPTTTGDINSLLALFGGTVLAGFGIHKNRLQD